VSEFGVSRYLIKSSRKLRKDNGILPNINSHGAKPTDDETIKWVQVFYHGDSVSRILPGAKDYVSLRVGDKRGHRQKSLKLTNLNELYALFRQNYTKAKIGLSKLCQLRPKECITVVARGTHSVCICTIHENVKLMLSTLPAESNVTYHELMDKLVCNLESRDCMLHRCSSFPKKDGLMLYLQQLCNTCDENDLVHYKRWESTDRTTLVEFVLEVTD